ncbi:hypothetical protein KJK32_10100 [Streptomyces sp. JCM17656]|nr:hypothetical protein KJK32_10100 [Streptomyces sp. JCM17656]
MNDVVAVALITAMTTLAAGAIAGGFAYAAANRQAESQEGQAREARAEQRVVRHREVRRDVYVRFLNCMDDAHACMNRVWTEKPIPLQESTTGELLAAANQVGKMLTVVSLEGPPNVAEVAKVIFGTFVTRPSNLTG